MQPTLLDTVKSLAGEQAQTCVSLYLPTYRGGTESFQNPVRLKTLLRRAEAELLARGIGEADTQAMLHSVERLLNAPDFWQHPSDGLAVFFSPQTARCLWLPQSVAEEVSIAGRFDIKPLLPLLNGDGRFYILALSQNAVRLLEATRASVREIEIAGAPRSLAEALRYDDPERQLQLHSSGAGSNAIFHGHAVDREEDKINLLRFFLQVDQGLHPLLREEKAPLVLAGVEYLFPLYREANTYPYLLEEGVAGNPEHLRDEALRDRAWAIVQPHFAAEKRQALARYAELLGTGHASDHIEEIVPAARYGRIDALLVADSRPQWGRYEDDHNQVVLHATAEPGDEDLVNYAAIQTLLNGGTIYTVEPEALPGGAALAAVFRY